MDPIKSKFLRDYLVFTVYFVFIVVVFFILWPLNRSRTSYFLILSGFASLAMRPFIPEGLKKTGWTTEKQRRDMLWGGIVGILLGLVMLRFKWLLLP